MSSSTVPTSKPAVKIIPVRTPTDLATAIALFTAYATSLPISLTFQNFEAEMASMPGKYAPPDGELLLALNAANSSSDAVGCVALRPLSPGCCEMKRLWVSPAGRGLGVGKALVEAVLEVAREKGYVEVRLDTLPSMEAAIGLYGGLGFERCERYYDTPIEGTVFLRKILTEGVVGQKKEDGVTGVDV